MLVFRILCVVVLPLFAGCATVEKSSANHPAANHDYPMWTKAAGWMLTPLTGASKTVEF